MTDPNRRPQSPDVNPSGQPWTEPSPAPPTRGADPAGVRASYDKEKLFRDIYNTEFGYVWNALRRFGVWERDLEDAAHDLFIVVHRKLDTYDRDRPIKPWLLGIAFRVASDFRRRAQHRNEVVKDDVVAVAADIPADALIAERERRELVWRALEALDTDRRAVFVLHEIEGYAIPAIAEMIDVPLNTCYSRLRVARERFAAAVRRIRASAQPPSPVGGEP